MAISFCVSLRRVKHYKVIARPFAIFIYFVSQPNLGFCHRMYNRRFTQRWSHFLTQPAKVDSPIQRMIHHEDAETIFG